jgi:hypothetical protein
MIHLQKFTRFHKIEEKLGILTELEWLATIIQKELQDENYFQYTGQYLGVSITIDCYKNKTTDDYTGSLGVESKRDYHFKLTTELADFPTILHELKHMDRKIRRKMKVDTHFWINHIGRDVIRQYPHLFKSKSLLEILLDTFYFCNPDEFEAYFHSLKADLDIITQSTQDPKLKFDLIDSAIKDEEIYQIFKFYYKNPFDLRDFFNTTADCNFFIKEFFRFQQLHADEQTTKVGKLDLLKSWFNSTILNKIRPDEKEDSQVKQFNFYINKIVKNNFKKFSRLYVI